RPARVPQHKERALPRDEHGPKPAVTGRDGPPDGAEPEPDQAPDRGARPGQGPGVRRGGAPAPGEGAAFAARLNGRNLTPAPRASLPVEVLQELFADQFADMGKILLEQAPALGVFGMEFLLHLTPCRLLPVDSGEAPELRDEDVRVVRAG